MFVCSLAKTFGHLSDRAKKIKIDKALTLEHYTRNKVFVSPPSQSEPFMRAGTKRVQHERASDAHAGSDHLKKTTPCQGSCLARSPCF
jgi:hypothetical protein